MQHIIHFQLPGVVLLLSIAQNIRPLPEGEDNNTFEMEDLSQSSTRERCEENVIQSYQSLEFYYFLIWLYFTI